MKKLVVLGGGESGTGAAVLAKKNGLEVFVSDKGTIPEPYKNVLLHHEIAFEMHQHSIERILEADEIIKSPGIPDEVPLIRQARDKGIPVISEIEFAARYTNATIIGITGSNGKTTTSLLTYYILKGAGLNVGLAGNVGKSFALQVAEESFDYYVLELSSFQLDGIDAFRPHIAILLNITPDHLDRYQYDQERYANAKFNIIKNLKANDHFIYCADDEVIANNIKKRTISAQQYGFSLCEKPAQGAWIEEGILTINIHTKQTTMIAIHELALQGKHNTYNSMAAAIASRLLGLRKESIRESLTDFQGVEHRLERFVKVFGIEFINDSKATNINSVWYALESMHKPVVWIVGGVDKGNDYSVLKELVRNKVKAIVCLGKNNEKIHAAFQEDVDIMADAASMEEAVKLSYNFGKKGDAVLLSPACASFDLFENYEDRGRQFKNAVRQL